MKSEAYDHMYLNKVIMITLQSLHSRKMLAKKINALLIILFLISFLTQ